MQLSQSHPTAVVCRALGVPRASLYRERRRRQFPREVRLQPSPPRTLSGSETEEVAHLLHSRRFVDKAPAAVWAELLDEGRYLCSIRTMYRILKERNEVRERRLQRRHPQYEKPELLATASQPMLVLGHHQAQGTGQMELFLPVRGHGHLQPLRGGLDGGHPGELFLGQDADRRKLRKAANRLGSTDFARRPGASMKSQALALLLADLGVTKSHSRPHVQDDNPYSESHFKTLKYRPEFPRRFGSIQDAREFCREFFRWYNTEHRHSEIGLHTPEDVHYLRAESRRQVRAQALQAAFARSPERFPNGQPVPPSLPAAVWINRPNQEDS